MGFQGGGNNQKNGAEFQIINGVLVEEEQLQALSHKPQVSDIKPQVLGSKEAELPRQLRYQVQLSNEDEKLQVSNLEPRAMVERSLSNEPPQPPFQGGATAIREIWRKGIKKN